MLFKPENSAMITTFPKGRQRVKSLQTFMQPVLLPPLGAPKQQRQLQEKVSPSQAIASKAEERHKTSQSLGSRSATGQSSNNFNAANGGKNSNFNNEAGAETFIKLLVRIRPTLSSESATQCIQVQKVQTEVIGTPAQVLETQSSSLSMPQTIKNQKSKSATRRGTNMMDDIQETTKQAPSIIKLMKGYNKISFKFDQVLPEGCSQEISFKLSSLQIVQNFVALGSSATIFAYGQTGAGKTYTIMGGSQQSNRRKDGRSGVQKKLKLSTSEKKGILPRVLDNLFISPGNQNVTMDRAYIVSFYEIYNDKVHDLLKPPTFSPHNSNGSKEGSGSQMHRDSLDVREKKDGNFMIHNLKKAVVNTRQEAYIWLEKGLQNRQICATNQNAASSRSHTIFQIEIPNTVQNSILRIVDLAGSEKYCYSNASQDLKMKELSSINQSLSILGQCISALGDPQRRHIPFRNCKLTKILKDSLMQPNDSPTQTMVALIVCISPSVDSYQETQSTLQFADRAKKAILNQSNLQLAVQGSSLGLTKMNSQLLDNMASEMEKLRKENAELKSHLQVMRQSSSQGNLLMFPIDSSSLGQTPVLKNQRGSIPRESIDLRLSDFARDEHDNQVIIQPPFKGEESGIKYLRPKKESSQIDQQEASKELSKNVLRSCFKGTRAQKEIELQKVTLTSQVLFKRTLDNDHSLDDSIRERIEHNLKYNDDTIFENLDIFQNIGETNNKVHGSKDKFNAKKLLGTPIEVSEDEENVEKQKGQSGQSDLSSLSEPISSDEKKIGPNKATREERIDNNQIRMSSGDLQEFENNNNNNSGSRDLSQMQSFSQSNIQGTHNAQNMWNSFLPDMPSSPFMSKMKDEIPQNQDTLNLTNELSNDLFELGNDRQFQNTFAKDRRNQEPSHVNQKTKDRPAILIQDESKRFLEFNDKQEDSLPLSGSLAFENEGSEKGRLHEVKGSQTMREGDDMFKAQDKLFLNDMSNIIQVEEQMTQRSFDPSQTNQTSTILMTMSPRAVDSVLAGNAQQQLLQQTLILDAEEDTKQQRRSVGKQNGTESPQVDEDEEEFLNLVNTSKSKKHQGRRDLQCNVSGGENMISFDASRISPEHGKDLDISQTNMMNNMMGQLVSQLNPWQPSQRRRFGQSRDASEEQHSGVKNADFLDSREEQQLIKPHDLEKNFLQDLHAGSLFGRNHKKLAMPSQERISLGSPDKNPNLKEHKLNHDEILTFSLTNTFSTIQSLGGELNTLRNNLEMTKKQSSQITRRQQKTGNQMSQNQQKLKDPDRIAQAPVSGAKGIISQSSNTPLREPKPDFKFSKRLQVRRSQERIVKNQQNLVSVPIQPKIISARPTGGVKHQLGLPPQQTQSLNNGKGGQQMNKKSQGKNVLGTTSPTPLQTHSNIVAGDRINQIEQNQFEEEDSCELVANQSLSLDLTTFSRDLQAYYNKIHYEIAQLKEILLKTQHERKQQVQNQMGRKSSDHHDFNLISPMPKIKQPGQRLKTRPHHSLSPQPLISNLLSTGSQQPKKINKDAIFRAQELIEQIKTEIMNGFSKQRHATTLTTSGFSEKKGIQKEDQSQASGVAREQLQQREKPISSMQTFHLRQQVSEPSRDSELEPVSTMHMAAPISEELMVSQRNVSSQNVVSLLQRLQNELLETIPPQKSHLQSKSPKLKMQPMTAQKLVKNRLDLHPQFEEISGSQERSPYVVRHMQVQRQNWIQMEESKGQKQFFQASLILPSYSNFVDAINDPPAKQLQATRLQGTSEQAKKTLEDTIDVNVTSNSGAMLADQSSHIIQRPLPVNRIQKKITKDRNYGIEQNRAPRPSPEKMNLLEEMFSPQKQIRSLSGGKKNAGDSSKEKPRGFQGSKTFGGGIGSLGQDNTLTLIFDSDEEMQDAHQNQNQNLESVLKGQDQKRLSEIVEDYLDESNYTPTNMRERRIRIGTQKSLNDNSQLDDFGGEIQSHPFQKASVSSGTNRQQMHSESPPLQDDFNQNQHSFMQESSLQNLFSMGFQKGGMVPLEDRGQGGSRISKHHGSSIRSIAMPQLTQFSEYGGYRLSEINLPIMQIQNQDLSHISDDDLAFFLGSQGLNNNPTSLVETHPSFEPVMPQDKRPSKILKAASDRNLFEIKEVENASKEVEQTSETLTQKKKQIAVAQKWAPPPRIKNLPSKKSKKHGSITDDQQPLFQTRQTIFHGQEEDEMATGSILAKGHSSVNAAEENLSEEKKENHAKSVSSNLVNVIGAQETTKNLINANERHISSEPKKSLTQAKPGSMIFINQSSGSRPFKTQAQINNESVNRNQSFKPMMSGSGTQAQNPQLTQHLMPPIHQTSMEMQEDMSRISENFDEADYQEQNNSSSKQSVHKYLFQFFNPSAKLHLQQQQFRAQTAFRQSNSSSTMSASSASKKTDKVMSTTQNIPTGIAAGIPRSTGKKSPLTTANRRSQQTQGKNNQNNLK